MALTRSGGSVATHCYIVPGQTSPEDALSSASNYPASGSYIDVSGCDAVDVIIHLGAINASDTPGFSLKCSDANNGTLDAISASYTSHDSAANDDDEFVTFHLETSALPSEHYYIAVTTSAVSNGSYGDIVFYLWKRSLPVSQSDSLLPSASIHTYHGQA